MKLYQIFLNTEIQSDYKIVYYDYIKEQRIEVSEEDYTDKYIRYLYVDDGILYIEIDNDEEVEQ